MPFRTLDEAKDVQGKTALVRVDFNVPMADSGIGKVVSDDTRLRAAIPTIRKLMGKGAKVVLLSHFDRPKGKRVASMSLKPVVGPLAALLGQDVAFADDCVGPSAKSAIAAIRGRNQASVGLTEPYVFSPLWGAWFGSEYVIANGVLTSHAAALVRQAAPAARLITDTLTGLDAAMDVVQTRLWADFSTDAPRRVGHAVRHDAQCSGASVDGCLPPAAYQAPLTAVTDAQQAGGVTTPAVVAQRSTAAPVISRAPGLPHHMGNLCERRPRVRRVRLPLQRRCRACGGRRLRRLHPRGDGACLYAECLRRGGVGGPPGAKVRHPGGARGGPTAADAIAAGNGRAARQPCHCGGPLHKHPICAGGRQQHVRGGRERDDRLRAGWVTRCDATVCVGIPGGPCVNTRLLCYFNALGIYERKLRASHHLNFRPRDPPTFSRPSSGWPVCVVVHQLSTQRALSARLQNRV